MTFDANNSVLPVTVNISRTSGSVTYFNTAITNAATASNEYFTISGWFTAKTGGTKIAEANGNLCASTAYTNANKQWTYTSNVTLYAQWAKTRSETYIANTATSYSIKMTSLSSSGSYLLLEDINLSGATWTPISSFSGTLNGNGYCIYNFEIKQSGKGVITVGFITTNNGTIKNISIGTESARLFAGDNDVKYSVRYQIEYQEDSSQSQLNIGGIAGMNTGTIDHCYLNNVYIYGKISDNNNDKVLYLRAGGVTSHHTSGTISYCTVKNSYIKVEMPIDKADSGDDNSGCLGGIVGVNYSTVKNCCVRDNILYIYVGGDGKSGNKAYPDGQIGAMVGIQESGGTITDCGVFGNAMTIMGSSGGKNQRYKERFCQFKQ